MSSVALRSCGVLVAITARLARLTISPRKNWEACLYPSDASGLASVPYLSTKPRVSSDEAAFEHLLGTPIDALIKGGSIGIEA